MKPLFKYLILSVLFTSRLLAQDSLAIRRDMHPVLKVDGLLFDKIFGAYMDSLNLAKTKTSTDTIIELEVKLAESVKQLKKGLAYCGVFRVELPIKFHVIKIIKGAYSKKEILINWACPLEAFHNKWLEDNKIYNYKLKRYSGVLTYTTGKKPERTTTNYYELVE